MGASKNQRLKAFNETRPDQLSRQLTYCFRPTMTDLCVVDNRRRLLAVEAQGKRVLIRVGIDVYTQNPRQTYVRLRRAGSIISCKDAQQAEAALVAILQMVEGLDGKTLDDRKLVMERL